ncbi:hypothetical protein Patl1_27292 [Pistacia atlantica]|uniref:Uncharacterized protein n=1 Tax=Pistacia atlantica TaxID=434234 RepID=A0ACC1BEA4_9ROSI|nr:hypothetical protein Patl1_27292 [Pistacia atlantica]
MPSFGHSSQNGNDHSGTRDGYQEWGDSNIQDIVFVINLLAARYANQSSLAPGVTLDTLEKYYKAGYNAKELLQLANGASGVAIDVHYYNLFSDTFNNFDVQ